ncbi:hypothetical protein P5663_06865 [Priestia flexa]|uniref:hypothetical protein n=1 Tax=Priestia flexa TaxID=86664 RepID=UPI00240D307E|nr:hypothetical protein [Priestia flexa]WEZ09560.1 hypothetical protein P5663_06865 [Priestia flexa]
MKNLTINHVHIKEEAKNLFIINLAMQDGSLIHIKDESELYWAHSIARSKFAKQLNIPIILQRKNGENMELNPEYSYKMLSE